MLVFSINLARMLAIATCIAALPACVQARYLMDEPGLNVVLAWRPTDELRDLGDRPVPRGPWQPLRVDTFADARGVPTAIGENIQHATHLPVTTTSLVGPFVAGGVRSVLAAQGLPLVAGAAQRALRGEVLQFFVSEDNTYNADVVLHLQVQSDEGKVLWDGTVAGRSKRWGRSLSEDNYAEAYGNAVVEAAKNLFVDAGFQAAVGNGSPAALLAEPPPAEPTKGP